MKMLRSKWSSHILLSFLFISASNGFGEVENIDEPYLILGNNENIQFLPVAQPNNIETLIKGLYNTMSCDYLYTENLVFWMDAGQGKIQATYTNITERNRKKHDIITRDLLKPDGLACDWVNKKLYWADAETDRIEVSEINGQNRKVIIWEKLDEPRAIAVDPSRGFMYWTDWGDNPKIERAGMDGSHRSVLLEQDGIFWPNGLTIDYEMEKLYWVDANHHFINRMNFDGSGREVVQGRPYFADNNGNNGLDTSSDSGRHPFAVTLSGDKIYWTDWATSSIHSSAKNGSGKSVVIKDNIKTLHDIHAYGPHRQKPAPNPCVPNNGGCSHLCLLSPVFPRFTCACPTGIRMKADNKTCEDTPRNILLVARRPDLRLISLDTPDFTDIVLPLQDVRHAVAIDYDPVEGFVYWTDYEEHAISRAKLDGSEQKMIITEEIEQSDGIAIDWIARNLYWTDMNRNYIAVSRLNGNSRKYIITDEIDEPRAIVLDPMEGYFYWSDWGNQSKIERSTLDGSQRNVLVNTSVTWPNGLALDYNKRLLYWAEAELDKIECIGLDGSNRKVLLSERIPHVFGFSLLNDQLYWTDWNRRRVERMGVNDRKSRTLIIDQLPDLMGLKAISKDPILGTNPCAVNDGGCSHLCLYTPMGPKCHCPTGLEILADMKTCIEPKAFLLYSLDDVNMVDVKMFSLETAKGMSKSLPFHTSVSPSLIDFTVQDSRIYWVDIEEQKIFRAFLNGTEIEAVVELGLELVEGIAVDWLSGNIYWTNFPSSIEVMKIGSTSRRTVIWEGLDMARCLALDPNNGYIYWSEWSLTGGIKRAEMDGSNNITLIPEKYTHRANSLTIDFKEHRLYWADIDAGVIRSSNLSGGDIRLVISEQQEERIYTLALYQGYVFWSDSLSLTINRANKTEGNNPVVLQTNVAVADMKVFHASRQTGMNACAHNNGGCQHLCFAAPEGKHKCACPAHYTLNADNTTCTAPLDFLLISEGKSINQIVYNKNEKTPEPSVLPIHGLKHVCVVDNDPVEHYLYWLNCDRNEIVRARQNGTENSTVLSNKDVQRKKILDFKIDPFNRLVFWIDDTGAINLMRIGGLINGTVFQGNNVFNVQEDNLYIRPKHLTISPKNSVMFFTSTNSKDRMSIIKASYSGKIIKVFFKHQLKNIIGISLDMIQDKLYWISDSGIEQCDVDGSKRKKIIKSGLTNPLGIAVSNSEVFWIDTDINFDNRGLIEKLSGSKSKVVQSRIKDLSAISAVNAIHPKDLELYPCHSDNGGCSHVCLNNIDGTSSCACPVHLKIQNDNFCDKPPTCSPDQFTCETVGDIPPCIPLSWRCDGQKECADGSDEKNCPICKSSDSFRCGAGMGNSDDDGMSELYGILGTLADISAPVQCVAKSKVCDGSKDCFDASDEQNCATCLQPEFPCGDGSRCITKDQLCDKTKDCADGSDENQQDCNALAKFSFNSSTIEFPLNNKFIWHRINKHLDQEAPPPKARPATILDIDGNSVTNNEYDQDNSTLILVGIGAVFALVFFVIIVFVFRKCRTQQNQNYPQPMVMFTPGLGEVQLSLEYRSTGEGTSVVHHGHRGQNTATKKAMQTHPSINLSIGPNSVQHMPIVKSQMPHPSCMLPQYPVSYDHNDQVYPGNHLPFERPHIPGASSSGSSTKYGSGSVTKQYLPTLNPPPSPATDRSGSKSTGEGFYSSDTGSQSARGSCRCKTSHRHRRYHHRMHMQASHPTTPCTSDTCEDYSYHSSASGDCRHMASKSGRPSSPPPPYCPHCYFVCPCQGCHPGHHQSYHAYPYPPPLSYHSHRYHPHGYSSGATSSSSGSQNNAQHSDGNCPRSCYHKGSRHHQGSRHSSRAGSSGHRPPPPAYIVMTSDLNSDSDPFAPPPTPRSQYLSDYCNTHDEADDGDDGRVSSDPSTFVNIVEEDEEEKENENTPLMRSHSSEEVMSKHRTEISKRKNTVKPTGSDPELSETEIASEGETVLLTSRATSPSLTEHSYQIFNPPPSPATDSS